MQLSPDNLRCQYPHKPCSNTRSIKKDGETHKFCEFHRDRANNVQKVYATKRRQQIRELKRLCGIKRKHRRVPVQPIPYTNSAEPPAEIDPLDLSVLQLLLDNEELETKPSISDDDNISEEDFSVLCQILS
ncbi:hypothetical protein AC1031_003621 [Aphanomyces cochlioides]|nr:hypothetical protein AC1031_003621 [Aphanomyces cochlioides]